MAKRIAAISLDLDNLWSYLKIHGDPYWEKYPSYLSTFIPYVLNLLDKLQIKITFFIVGIDADLEENRKYLKLIIENGHSIGNHSYNHESWLQNYTRDEVIDELVKSERAIESITGCKPIGFRGPGFSWSNDLLDVLAERGYHYDSSTLPTFIGPLARVYYFWKSNLSHSERKSRNKLFGTLKDGFRKNRPYRLSYRKTLIEIPVTTVPFFKIPFHLSYLIYLYRISPFLMRIYLEFALSLCDITRIVPNFLLHPLDLIGSDQISRLAFFPGMDLDTDIKIKIFNEVISKLKERYDIVSLDQYTSMIRDSYKNSENG